jgi:hypothetical protein
MGISMSIAGSIIGERNIGWSIFEVAVFRICKVICRDRNNISIKFVLFSESLRVKSG